MAAASAGKKPQSESTTTTRESESKSKSTPIITLSPAPTRPRPARPGHLRKRSVPSLEQITERYAHGSPTPAPAQEVPGTPVSRLPAFLAARRQTPSPPPGSQQVAEVVKAVPMPVASKKEVGTDVRVISRPRLARTGRIPTPPSQTTVSTPPAPAAPVVRSRKDSEESATQQAPAAPQPPSPCPRLRSRTSTARDMLCAVRRRTVMYGFPSPGPLSPCSAVGVGAGASMLDRQMSLSLSANPKRISAPAELGLRRSRSGFAHPVLSMPGGF